MNPLYLEVYVVVLGIILLMAEAFAGAGHKRGIAYAGILGLLGVLAATFFADSAAMNSAAPYAKFYRADALAIFLKQFALLSTVIVIVMAVATGTATATAIVIVTVVIIIVIITTDFLIVFLKPIFWIIIQNNFK